MRPLDRDNAQFRADAAAMREGALEQRLQDDEQRQRIRLLKKTHDALRTRLRLGERSASADGG
jgi:hypothetical protein